MILALHYHVSLHQVKHRTTRYGKRLPRMRMNINCRECLSFLSLYSTMGFLWPLSSLYALLVFLATCVIAIPSQPILRQADGPFKPGFEQQAVSAYNRPLSCGLVDICASVDIGLVAELGPIIGLDTLESVLTKSRLCLCIKVGRRMSSV